MRNCVGCMDTSWRHLLSAIGTEVPLIYAVNLTPSNSENGQGTGSCGETQSPCIASLADVNRTADVIIIIKTIVISNVGECNSITIGEISAINDCVVDSILRADLFGRRVHEETFLATQARRRKRGIRGQVVPIIAVVVDFAIALIQTSCVIFTLLKIAVIVVGAENGEPIPCETQHRTRGTGTTTRELRGHVAIVTDITC
mmetsp:Transcript_44930/g.66095  ORF Transcript_44930/g.66095 Transcript_44930/m.66095 type:complete len:201 (-) Transcript_44930:526-1128(-)